LAVAALAGRSAVALLAVAAHAAVPLGSVSLLAIAHPAIATRAALAVAGLAVAALADAALAALAVPALAVTALTVTLRLAAAAPGLGAVAARRRGPAALGRAAVLLGPLPVLLTLELPAGPVVLAIAPALIVERGSLVRGAAPLALLSLPLAALSAVVTLSLAAPAAAIFMLHGVLLLRVAAAGGTNVGGQATSLNVSYRFISFTLTRKQPVSEL